MRKLGPTHLELLRAVGTDFGPLEALNLSIPRSTLYYQAKQLLTEGLLEWQEGVGHRLSPDGQAFLAGLDVPPECRPWILPDRVWTPLSILPDAYRAFIELAVSVPPVRFYKVYPENFPSFLLIGPEQSGKTSVARIIIALLGGDIDEDVIVTSDEDGKSLSIRVDARGRQVSRRDIMDRPVIGFDELGDANPKTWNLIRTRYMFGVISFSRETGPNEFLATPIAIMNPRKGSTLEERTGFKGPALRRLIVMDVTKVPLPDEFITRARTLAVEAGSFAPAKLPRATPPSDELKARVLMLLRKVAAEDRCPKLRGIDVISIAITIRGAVARGVSEERAFRAQIWNYCTVVDTVGYMRDGWRLVLTEEFGGKSPLRAPPSKPDKATTTTPRAPAKPVPQPTTPRAATTTTTTRAPAKPVLRPTPPTPDKTTKAAPPSAKPARQPLKVTTTPVPRTPSKMDHIERLTAAMSAAVERDRLAAAEKAASEIPVRQVVKAKKGKAPAAFTVDDLLEIFRDCPRNRRWRRYRTLILLGVVGGLHADELVTARLEGTQIDPGGMLVAFDGRSGKAETIYIPTVKGPLCAVGAVARWIAQEEIEVGFLFFRPGFKNVKTDDAKHLSVATVDKIVKAAAYMIDKDRDVYDSRSLRESFPAARKHLLEVQLKDIDALRRGPGPARSRAADAPSSP